LNDGSEQGGKPSFLLLAEAMIPEAQPLLDNPNSEDGKRSLAVVLNIEPLLAPTLVGCGDIHHDVLDGAVPPEVDAGTAHWGVFTKTVNKYRLSSKWGSTPRKSSHIVMKIVICWIPLRVKCCRSIL
jgi:hypothetical protein